MAGGGQGLPKFFCRMVVSPRDASLDMSPCRSIPNPRNVGGTNTPPSANLGVSKVAGAYRNDVAVFQFRPTLRFASRLRSVNLFIENILSRSGPPQIVQSVVQFVIVSMGGMMLWRRWLTFKSKQNGAVDANAKPLAVLRKANAQIASVFKVGLAQKWPRSLSARNPLYAAESACGIARRKRYSFPNLGSVISVIHSVSPYVRGQGRAVLNALLRPDLHSRFTFRSQTERNLL